MKKLKYIGENKEQLPQITIDGIVRIDGDLVDTKLKELNSDWKLEEVKNK